jgi:hypothetical protein
MALERTADELAQQLGRLPTMEEMALHTGLVR